MIGTDEVTGRVIHGEAFLRQSVRRVLRTLKGSLPMQREFGINHLSYLGRGTTEQLLLDLTSETVTAVQTAIAGVRVESTGIDMRDGELWLLVRISWNGNQIELEEPFAENPDDNRRSRLRADFR